MSKHGQPAKSLTSEENIDFLHVLLRKLGRGVHKVAGKMIIVHDRDPSHQSADAVKLVETMGLNLMLLPPRSPDRMPLDYTAFPNVKRRLEKNKPADWDARCSMFAELIRGLQPAQLVQGYIERLEKVIAVQGGHVED